MSTNLFWDAIGINLNNPGPKVVDRKKLKEGCDIVSTMISKLMEDEWQRRHEERERKQQDPLQDNKFIKSL